MAITVQALRLKSLNITFDENNTPRLEGSYQLISTVNTVLATQSFGGYSDVKVNPPAALSTKLHETVTGLSTELSRMIGLE